MERATHTPVELLPHPQEQRHHASVFETVQLPQILSPQLDPGAWLPLGIGPLPLFPLPPVIQANDPEVDPLLLRIMENTLSNDDLFPAAV